MTFDVSADDWQACLKEKIMSNIERYFYLIVFAMYIREVGPNGFPKTFKEWMDDHASLRDMIAEGRGKLEWERKIPDEKLGDLKDMLNTAEFKNNSMHKLASKTMIEILPDHLLKHIETKCGSLANTPDFFDVIGQVSWFEAPKA